MPSLDFAFSSPLLVIYELSKKNFQNLNLATSLLIAVNLSMYQSAWSSGCNWDILQNNRL